MGAVVGAAVDGLCRFRTLPRAEVHVHLEGCFEADLLAQWAGRFGEPMPRPRERLNDRYLAMCSAFRAPAMGRQ